MRKILFLLCGLLLSTKVVAYEDCKIELLHDVRVNNTSLQVSESTESRYEIRREGYLSVDGESLELTGKQRTLAEEFAGEVASVIPRWIKMVSDALLLAENTLAEALGEAFGPDSAATVNSTRAIALARQNFERSARDGDSYLLSASQYNDLEATLEDEMEEAFTTAMGAAFKEIGRSLGSDDRSFLQNMEAFGEHMKRIADATKYAAAVLEENGRELCADTKALKKLETRLSRSIPQLEDYPIFK
jgi:hypothetical protein